MALLCSTAGERRVMVDLIYIAVVVVFFVLSALYARFCEKL